MPALATLPPSRRLLALLGLLWLAAPTASAERRLETSLDAGGELSGPGYRLELVIGQADAGRLAATRRELQGGFLRAPASRADALFRDGFEPREDTP